jgi:hypothetical protein
VSIDRDSAKLSDRLRLILLLDACEFADLVPVPIASLHAIAYLANVLAPIWSEQSYDGKILKRKGSPFYPELQRELDSLVGLGVVEVYDVSYVKDDDGWRLNGTFALNDQVTRPFLESMHQFFSERLTSSFLRRLAIAVGRLKRPVEEIVRYDVTWSDERTGTGNIVDFSEWQRANYSAAAADFFEKFAPKDNWTTRGDKLQLYLHLLERRAHAG